MGTYSIAIVGGGIVGLSTAYALTKAGIKDLVVLEAERRVGRHQTGHNSGVIHSGLYYVPGSLKARHCVEGREAMYRFCQEQGVPHERCGKLVVATTPAQQDTLRLLERRGAANGLAGLRRMPPEEMREREPHVSGVEALLVPDTGIVDFVGVAEAYARLINENGADVRTSARVLDVHRDSAGLELETDRGSVRARHLINCAGLYSDRIARMAGCTPDVRIIPFRGQYMKLKDSAVSLVRHLIYPVPDPQFPFLGVHFTRMIDGGVEAGPNALLTLRRDWYVPGDKSDRDWSVLRYAGFWRMAGRYGRVGAAELWRARSTRAFVAALQELVPDIGEADMEPHGSGIRAQAVNRQGRLADDFSIVSASRQIHVLNAPSPAATASLSIGQAICDMARARFF